MNVLNAEQMREADRHTIHELGVPSIQLMENAARRVAQVLLDRYVIARNVAVVCGKGNNGGDGLAVARFLREQGWTVTALLIGRAAELKDDPSVNWKRAKEAGVICVEAADASTVKDHLQQAEIVVDGLFGTGLIRPLQGVHEEIVDAINMSGKSVVAIDVPSGLSSDTGALIGPAVRADVCVALAALKYCHVCPPASEFCGQVHVVEIGIETKSDVRVLVSAQLRELLPSRKAESHKGTYGHALVLAGSTGKSGAAYMTAKAALRAGSGLVTVYSPAKPQMTIAALGPEIMAIPSAKDQDYFSEESLRETLAIAEGKDAIAIGPGIGTHGSTGEWLRALLPQLKAPVVIDADALNLLAENPAALTQRTEPSILTPHPGEMARLLKSDVATVQNDRVSAAITMSKITQAVVVLKGYRSLIAEPNGKVLINPSGGPALASAGTGDFLTGVLISYLSQGLAPLDAALAGVFLHGFVGNLFQKIYPNQSLNAMDIASYWNQAVKIATEAQDVESEYFHLYFS